MPAGYRDSLEGLRAQIDALRSELRPLEARLRLAPWCVVATAWGLAPSAQMPSAEGMDYDGLAALQLAAESRLRALRAFFTQLPDERTGWTTAPPNAPALPAWPWAGPGPLAEYAALAESTHAGDFECQVTADWLAGFGRALQQVAPGTRAFGLAGAPEPGACGAYFARAGVPLAAEVRVEFSPDRRGHQRTACVRTSVAFGAGPVKITPQGIADDLLALIGFRRDVQLDDAEFDGMFFVRGDESAARDALTEPVRRALLVVAREDVPTLEIGDGLATLSWSYPPSVAALGAAADALVGIRAAPVTWPRPA